MEDTNKKTLTASNQAELEYLIKGAEIKGWRLIPESIQEILGFWHATLTKPYKG